MKSIELSRRKNYFQSYLRVFLSNNVFILLAILALVLIFGGIFVPNIFKLMNVINVIRVVSIVGIIAIGETFVLLTGEIDISVGSIMSLSLVTGGLFLDLGSVPALLITCATGLILGIINGVVVAKGRVKSLIVTLGTLSIYGGLALVVSRGQAVYLYGLQGYLWTGKGYFLGIPAPVIFFIAICVLSFIFLTFTSTGRYLYYTGANEMAAFCSGVRVDKIKILAFAIAGLCAAMAGPLFSSQTIRVTPIQGVGFELSAIAIVVLGGTTLSGGKGTILGTLIGALTYGFLLNILSLSGIGTYMEQVLKGVLLIVIVIVFQNVRRR